MLKVSLVVNVLVIGLKVVKWSSNGVGTKDLLEHDFRVYQLLHRSGAQNQRGTTGNQRHQQGEKQKKKTGHHSTAPHGSTAPQATAQGSGTPQGTRRATTRPDTGTKADTHHQTTTPVNQSHQQTPNKRQQHQERTTPATRNSTDDAHSTTKGHQHSAAQHHIGRRGQGTHSTTPQNTHSRRAAARNKQQAQATTQTNGRARQHTTTRPHSATEHNTDQRNTKTLHTEPQGGEPRGQTRTAPPKHDTKTHQETAEDSQAQQPTPHNTSQRTQSNDRDSTTEARAGTPDGSRHTNPPSTAQTSKKKGGGGRRGPRQPESRKRQRQQGGGAKKKKQKTGGEGGGQDAKAQGTRGRKTRKAGDNGETTRGGRGGRKNKKNEKQRKGGGDKTPRPKAPGAGKHAKQDTTGAQRGGGKGKGKGKQKQKKTQQQPQTGQPQPGGGRTSKERTKKGQRKGEAHQNAPGRPARPTRPRKHAHAHTCGTRAWRPPTRKELCRCPHETAPVHRPSPPSQDGQYGKPDASVTGSTHAKPPQRTQPKT